jgi:hypothetical protein
MTRIPGAKSGHYTDLCSPMQQENLFWMADFELRIISFSVLAFS